MIRQLFTCPKCDNEMTYTQKVLGWCYLPVHIAILPLLVAMIAAFSGSGMSEAEMNLTAYVVGLVFVLTAMGSWLRRSFDVLLDAPGRCVLCIAIAFAADYALSIIAQLLLMWLLGPVMENPNNAEIAQIASTDYGIMRAVAVFMAPIVEETLFRGVVFGSIRRKSRVLAYIVSMLLFGVYHVWQYALVYADPWLLIYMLQYLPVAFVLCWQYERSGSIWTPIVFHMLFNALAFFVLTQF